MSELLPIRSIACECGNEILRISTNVLGITASIPCENCGKVNEFKLSLQPEVAMAPPHSREEHHANRTAESGR